ncbi:unnamed protein product, partial [Vitis vinifera]
MGTMIQRLVYWLSEHPAIIKFRWSPTQSWGSTWSFLLTSMAFYLTLSLVLHLILVLFRRRRPVPLGPIPAVYSLSMALISAVIFTGTLFSAAAEIRDTRWFWRRSKTPLQWLLCFPLGTRPSGRAFFWSYAYYLSRFLHMFRTYFTILEHLEIMLATLVYSVVYGYKFWTAIGLPSTCFPFVLSCQMVLLGSNVLCHVGVLLLHLRKGGCNGIGAWIFNSVLNAAILLLFVNSFVRKMHLRRRQVEDDDSVLHSCSASEETKCIFYEYGSTIDYENLKVTSISPK